MSSGGAYGQLDGTLRLCGAFSTRIRHYYSPFRSLLPGQCARICTVPQPQRFATIDGTTRGNRLAAPSRCRFRSSWRASNGSPHSTYSLADRDQIVRAIHIAGSPSPAPVHNRRPRQSRPGADRGDRRYSRDGVTRRRKSSADQQSDDRRGPPYTPPLQHSTAGRPDRQATPAYRTRRAQHRIEPVRRRIVQRCVEPSMARHPALRRPSQARQPARAILPAHDHRRTWAASASAARTSSGPLSSSAIALSDPEPAPLPPANTAPRRRISASMVSPITPAR